MILKNHLFINKKYIRIFCSLLAMIIAISVFALFSSIDAQAGLGSDINITPKEVYEIPGNASEGDAAYSPSDAPGINASSAIVIDIDTGDILYEKDAFSKRFPAGMTKVMPCLLALKYGSVSDTVTVSEKIMSQVDEKSAFIEIKSGEKMSLRDAIYGMMLSPGNECALIIAENLFGSTGDTLDLMNKEAANLGCKSTHFTNLNGIHNEEHYTTCYDMALIGMAAYQYPEFKQLISRQSYTVKATNKSEERVLWEDNKLIFPFTEEYYYPNSTGGKTGYTEESLASLISFSEKDGRRFVTVVMKCDSADDSYLDTIKLNDFCYENYKLCKPLEFYNINDTNREDILLLDNYYNDLNHELLKYYVNQSYSFYVRSNIKEDEILKRMYFYPKPENNIAGQIEFVYNDEVIGKTEIFSTIPSITASSTDALKDKNNKIIQKDTSRREKIIKILRIIIIFIIVVLVVIIIVKIRSWQIMKKASRTVRYYPVSRDQRRQKEIEKDQGKEKTKENKDKNIENIKDNTKVKNKESIKENTKDRNKENKNINKENTKDNNKEKNKVNNKEKIIENNIENKHDNDIDN